MKTMKNSRSNLLVLILVLCFVKSQSQVLDESIHGIVYKTDAQVKAEVASNGFAVLNNAMLFGLTLPADGVHYLEAALIYTRDSVSDIYGNYWMDSLAFQFIKNGNVIDSGILRVKNQLNESFFEQVQRYRIDSLPITYTMKVTKIGSIVTPGSYLPLDIRVEFRIKTLRTEKLDTIKPNLYWDTIGNKTVNLRWDLKKGADFYELEYLFLDTYDAPTSAISWERALRIESIYNTYNFDRVYPTGTLYYRVRAVGKYVRIAGLADRIQYGEWSDSVIVNEVKRFSGDKPYQFISSFAEEGKNKRVISYFDNTLRGRQEVTYLNDEKTVLVGETDYDAEGRKSLSILPVPSPEGINDLGYKSKFNRDTTSNTDGYNFTHFDKISNILSLSTSSGAGKYYSSANTSGGIHNGYIPDAFGKPFVQTKYLRDNTDRVAVQSGVGNQYNIGSGKETRYFYITPTAIDIQKLFGTEVGDPSHYKKNIVVDPNGQGSVSYLDLSGKTIATAIIGSSPNNVRAMSPVSSTTMNAAMVTDNIADPRAIISSNTLMSEVPSSTFNFYYDLKPPTVVLKDSCKICSYQVSFYARDNMGMVIPLTNINTTGSKGSSYSASTGTLNVTLSQYGSWNCNQNTDTLKQAAFTVTMSTIGEFTVFKKLESTPISEKDLVKIAKTYIDTMKILTFVEEQNDTSHCYYNCENFCTNYIMNDPTTKNLTGDAKDSAIQVCILEVCEEQTKDGLDNIEGVDCESMRDQMAQQFEPNSTELTFLQLLKNGNDTACVKTKDIRVTDEGGNEFIWIPAKDSLWSVDSSKYINTKNVTVANNDPDLPSKTFNIKTGLILMMTDPAYYQNEWGEDIVKCHREYCWYEQCVRTTDSTNFSDNLRVKYAKYMQIDTGLFKLSPPYTNYNTQSHLIGNKVVDFDPQLDSLAKYQKCTNIKADLKSYMSDSTGNCYINKFSNSTDLKSLLTNKYKKNMYGYLAFVVDSAHCKNKINGCTPKEKEEQLWTQFTTAYQEIKLARYFSCSDCTLFKDTIAIVRRSDIHDVTNLDTLIKKIQDTSRYFKSNYVCPGSSGSWMDIFIQKYKGLPQIKLDTLNGYLKELCNQVCSPNPTMHCLVDNRTFEDNNSCGWNATYLPPYRIGIISRKVSSLIANNASNLKPVWQGKTITPKKEKLFILYQDSLKYSSGKNIRLTVYPESCNNVNSDSIYVAVYKSTNCDFGGAPNCTCLWGQIAVQKYYNEFGALIIEWKDTLKDNYNKYYAIQFFKESLTGPDQFSFEIQTPSSLFPSDYHKTNTYLKLDAATKIFNFVKRNKTNDTAVAYIKEVWDCEQSCKRIHPCMDTIIRNIKKYTDTVGILKDQSKLLPSPTCIQQLSLTTSDKESYFTYVMPNSTFVLNYIIDEYGGVINLKTAKILDYTTTNVFLKQIDNYSIANNSQDSMLRIKFLLKDTTNGALFQGFLIQYDKLKTIQFPDDTMYCNYNLVISDYTKECLNQLKERKDQQYKEILDNKVNEQISILLLTANCMKGISEKYTANYTTTEHQYTLYYYDQAGNVIRTIPPEGVVPLPMSAFDNGKLRNPNNIRILPPHNVKYASDYKYNSFNQIIDTKTPEVTGNTVFYYDYARRLRMSQNAKQLAEQNKFSYTVYDYLNRIVEVGEVVPVPGSNWTTQLIQDSIDANPNFPKSIPSRLNVVTTFYSTADPLLGQAQDNLKGRVAYSIRYGGPAIIDGKTHYNYDAHGNVKTVYQSVTEFGLKKAEYHYDLISGNVKKLAYQRGKKDQFYHLYDYDADNRLTKAYTSLDSILWDEEARYFYYRHGPLARVELGPEKVQGMDYYYTLQGWIKGTNRIGITVDSLEPGRDAYPVTSNINRYVARDGASYNLGYNSVDYSAIKTSINFGMTNSALTWAPQSLGGTILPTGSGPKGMYNGNIAYMINQYSGQAGFTDTIHAQTFQYDQLHRIMSSMTYSGNSGQNYNFLNPGQSTAYSYDRNGNILGLLRNTNAGVMDSITYKYNYAGRPNLLSQVNDNVAAGTFNEDIDNQINYNYAYDNIGNLTTDAQSTATITWDAFQKIRSVNRMIPVQGGNPYNQLERFYYDPQGNRIHKKNNSQNDSTAYYYIRDAGGNILSMYNRSYKNINNQYSFIQKEINIFGSSRLGTYEVPLRDMNTGDQISGKVNTRYRNYRRYESSNHLGNVMTVMSDRLRGNPINGQQKVNNYVPDIVAANDYYPFGQVMYQRNYPTVNGKNGFFTKYRYGFNDKESDSEGEVASLNTYDYGFRIYNPSIGRFLSFDPIRNEFPELTPYQFASNSPISNIDLDGLEATLSITNNVYFVKLKNVNFSFIERSANKTFTESAKNKTEENDFAINTQMFDYANALSYIFAKTPQPTNDYTPQGINILEGRRVSGRSSQKTFYFSLDNNTCKWSCGQGDVPTNSALGFGGGTPIIINGLKYGETNMYSSDAPSGLPLVGDPGNENRKYLTQRSNGVYKGQNNSLVGKTILGYNSKNDTWIIVSQQNQYNGMSLNDIRDKLYNEGYDNVLGYDGSTSSTLLNESKTITSPDSRKNNTIPNGLNLSVPHK